MFVILLILYFLDFYKFIINLTYDATFQINDEMISNWIILV